MFIFLQANDVMRKQVALKENRRKVVLMCLVLFMLGQCFTVYLLFGTSPAPEIYASTSAPVRTSTHESMPGTVCTDKRAHAHIHKPMHSCLLANIHRHVHKCIDHRPGGVSQSCPPPPPVAGTLADVHFQTQHTSTHANTHYCRTRRVTARQDFAFSAFKQPRGDRSRCRKPRLPCLGGSSRLVSAAASSPGFHRAHLAGDLG